VRDSLAAVSLCLLKGMTMNIHDPATPPNEDLVRLEVNLPRKLFNSLRTLGDQYGTGVHGVIRHLAHNAVDSARHKKP
jgi:hypothetical protein